MIFRMSHINGRTNVMQNDGSAYRVAYLIS